MVFLGREFLNSSQTLQATPTFIPQINLITLQHGIYDEIYLSKDTSGGYTSTIPTVWDFDVILHGLFNGNLLAGNVNFSADTIDTIYIKRRKKGTYLWVSLFEIPINKVEDFKVERMDPYCAGDQEYEYALVSAINHVEGNYNINSVKSSFEGIHIIDKEQIFSSLMDFSLQLTRNKPTSLVQTLNGGYPYVISNGRNNYTSGTLSATYLSKKDRCQFNLEQSQWYREQLMDFLCDGRPKILKLSDGRMWMIRLTGNPTETDSNWQDFVKTSFEFAEIADVHSGSALYDYGFIDVINGNDGE